MHTRLSAAVAWLAAAVVSFSVAACSRPDGGPIVLTIASARSVVATGLSSDETRALAAARLSNLDMQRVLRVSVAALDTPIAGAYVIADGAIEFTPAFPLDPGRAYTIELFQDAMPARRASGIIAATVSLPAVDRTPVTRVTAVHPTAALWPANLLRAYIHFSAPMGREGGVGRITLKDERGVEVADAFLPLDADFWNMDRTRYTLFFDPGRVKRGILPNRQQGRALVAGARYSLEVDADWHDALGRPLATAFRHVFHAGPAIEQPLSVADWVMTTPAPATREPLVVTFPWPIDYGLAHRALAVVGPDGQPVAGEPVLAPGDVRWSFTPRDPWAAGEYRVRADPVFEDTSGNQVGRAFEVDMKRAPPTPPDVPRWRLFRVAGK